MDSFASTLEALGFHQTPVAVLRILLPPGISFYTFQEVAYIVDVYHRKLEPAESFVDYALFISLFPHLIAGPIQRPAHLLPQVQSPRRFDDERFFNGLLLILSGLFRDRLDGYGARLVLLVPPVLVRTGQGEGWLGLMRAADAVGDMALK